MKYKAGYKYILAEVEIIKTDIFPNESIETEFIELDLQGYLTMKAGYPWDGCSGPTKDTPSNMRAGGGHDALYKLMRMELLSQRWRKEADEFLKKIFIEDGMKVAEKSNKIMRPIKRRLVKIRAAYFYKAVRKFGLSSASAENRRPILEAP